MSASGEDLNQALWLVESLKALRPSAEAGLAQVKAPARRSAGKPRVHANSFTRRRLCDKPAGAAY
jgi:hypothetical protein